MNQIAEITETVNNCAVNTPKIYGKYDKTPEIPKTYKNIFLSYGNRTLGPLRSQIDTGNTLRCDLAIRKDVQEQLQIPFQNYSPRSTSTAKPGASLENLGKTVPISMKIDGIQKKFTVSPNVITSMADAVNIGSTFFKNLSMKQANVSIQWIKGDAILNLGNETTELIQSIQQIPERPLATPVLREGHKRTMERPTVAQRTRSPPPMRKPARKQMHVQRDTLLKQGTLTFVPVTLQHNSIDCISTILVEPVDMFDSANTQVVAGLYEKRAMNRIAILNIGHSPRILRKGETVATYNEVVWRSNPKSPEGLAKVAQPSSKVVQSDPKTIWKELKLDENKMLQDNPDVKAKLKQLITKHANVFSNPEANIGVTNLIEFDILLKENTIPVCHRLRPLNPEQKKDLKKTLDLWLKEGIIETAPPHSEWSAGLVPSLKKDGAIRWAVDYRGLNQATVADKYPLPLIESNLETLQGSVIYSALDAAAAYHTIPVSQRAKPYLAFITPFGLYTFRRMPFGPKNSGAVYSRFVDMVLQRINSPHIMIYIDDIIVHTADFNTHLEQLDKCLQAHADVGLKLRPHKSHLFQSEVNYLGYHISPGGISMIPKYVDRITDWPTPTTQKQLSSFLGFTGYYRSFIKDYSYLTNEMNTMKTQKQFEWTPEMEDKFKKLKAKFAEQPVRAYPDYSDNSEPFQLSVDFSCENLGAVLTQVQDGEERLIGVAGRKTTPYERNYHSTKGELASVLYGLRKFEHILRFKKFILWTDNASITWLKTVTKPRGITFRWLTELQSFDFDIKHRPGKQNILADTISRAEHNPPPSSEEIAEGAEYVYQILDDLDQTGSILNLDDVEDEAPALEQVESDPTLDGIKEAQQADPILQEVIQWVSTNTKPTKEDKRGKPLILQHYADKLPFLHLRDDVLYLKMRGSEDVTEEPPWRLVLPESKWVAMFKAVHEDPTSGHFGQRGTCLRATSRFYFPGIWNWLKTRVSSCQHCIAKQQHPNLHDTVHRPVAVMGYPGEKIFIDLVGPLNRTQDNMRYILTVEDGYTRFCQAIPIQSKEAVVVAEALFRRYICIFGCPAEIHSDQGTEFTNRILTELAEKFQIHKTLSVPYQPQSNIVERFHRTLNQMCRTLLERFDMNWDKALGAMTMAYNTKVHSSTGLTPFFMTFNREAKLPVDLIIPSPESQDRSVHDYVAATTRTFHLIYNFMRKKQNATIRRNAKLYTSGTYTFNVDDLVWYLCPRRINIKPSKIQDNWIGPMRIVEKINDVNLLIEPAYTQGRRIIAHATRCLPVNLANPAFASRYLSDQEIEAQEDELAEQIEPNEVDPNTPNAPIVPIVVQYPQPVDHFTDLTQKKRGRPPKQPTRDDNSNPNQPDNRTQPEPAPPPEPAPMDPGPGPSHQPDQPARRNVTREARPAPLARTVSTRHKSGNKRYNTSESDLSSNCNLPIHSGRGDYTRQVRLRRDSSSSTDDMPPPPTPQRHSQPQPPGPPRMDDSSDWSDSRIMNTIGTPDQIEVQLLSGSTVPKLATPGSAAYDFKSNVDITLKPRTVTKVNINLALKIPDNFCLQLVTRSGKALEAGLITVAGLIDPDYTRPVFALIYNSSDQAYRVTKGQNITQGVFLPRVTVNWKHVDELDIPLVDHRGFGSTDSSTMSQFLNQLQ